MWKKCLQPLLGFFGTYVGDKTCNLRKGLGNFLDQGWCCQGTTRVACSWCIGNKKFLIEPALPTLLHIEICGSFQPLEKIILCKVACATYKYLPRRGGGAKGNEVEVERSYLWTKHTPNTTTFLQSIDFWPRNSSWGAKLSAWWQNVWVLFGYLFKLDAYTWLMCVVERKSNNKHHKDMCLKEIRLYLQFFIDPCHNRYWTQFGRNVCV